MREGIKTHPEVSRFYLKFRSRVFHANCLLLLSHHSGSDETRTRDLRRDRALALLIKSTTYPGTPVISIPVESFSVPFDASESFNLRTPRVQRFVTSLTTGSGSTAGP